MASDVCYDLSICIPTYNHGKYIPKLLDSIIHQCCENIEIVVSDNASTDNTEEIILRYKKDFPHFTYFRWNENRGFDANAIKVLELAKGRYCWIIGSDDWIELGAIEKILETLRTEPLPTGITVEVNTYTIDEKLYESPNVSGEAIKLYGSSEIYSFRQIGYRFGFISAHIFDRSKVMGIVGHKQLHYNYYVVHQLLTWLVKENSDWIFYDSPLIAWRSGNDSITNKQGHYKRFSVDLNSYMENVALVFGDNSKIYKSFVDTQLMDCIKGHLFHKMYTINRIRIKIRALSCLYMHSAFWLKVFPIYFIPYSAIPICRKFYRKLLSRKNHDKQL